MRRLVVCLHLAPLASALTAADSPGLDALTQRVGKFHTQLRGFLDRNPKAEAEWKAEGQVVMQEANGLVNDLTTGEKSDAKKHLLEGVIGDIQFWGQHTDARAAASKTLLNQHDADFLMKLLLQRKNLPMPTQLAVLNRKDVADIRWAKALFANHTMTEPLAVQLKTLLAKEHMITQVKNGLPTAKELDSKEATRERKLEEAKEDMVRVAGRFSKTTEALARAADPKDASASKSLAHIRSELREVSGVGAVAAGQRTLAIPQRLKLLSVIGKELKDLAEHLVPEGYAVDVADHYATKEKTQAAETLRDAMAAQRDVASALVALKAFDAKAGEGHVAHVTTA